VATADRIKAYRRIPARDLVPNPRNWREHDEPQREALREILGRIGYADAALGRELPDGRVMLINGHMRAEEMGDELIGVVVTDLSEEEADLLLAAMDPLAAKATANTAKLEELLNEIDLEAGPLADLLGELAGRAVEEGGRVELRKMDTQRPPVMAWVLVGIPTVRFGEIAAAVEALAELEGVRIETTVGNG
jgi:hypothetical protein